MGMVGDIIEGTINNLLDKNKELYKTRMDICRSCKLLVKDPLFGEVCSKKIWINPATDETSSFYKAGYKNGCGCVMASKTRLDNAHCKIGKW